jgi:hypothetical protein
MRLLPAVLAVAMLSWAQLHHLTPDNRAAFLEMAKAQLFIRHIHGQ